MAGLSPCSPLPRAGDDVGEADIRAAQRLGVGGSPRPMFRTASMRAERRDLSGWDHTRMRRSLDFGRKLPSLGMTYWIDRVRHVTN